MKTSKTYLETQINQTAELLYELLRQAGATYDQVERLDQMVTTILESKV